MQTADLHAQARGARDRLKTLKSAVANATVQEDAAQPPRTCYVKECLVGPAPIMKRFLPRAQGRATPILKRSCHITIVVGARADALARGARRPGPSDPARQGGARPASGVAPVKKTARRATRQRPSLRVAKRSGRKVTGGACGSENSSDRLEAGDHPDLGLALVRAQEGVRQLPGGGHQDPAVPRAAPRAGGRQPRSIIQRAANKVDDQHRHRQAGPGHRPARHAGQPAPRRAAAADRARRSSSTSTRSRSPTSTPSWWPQHIARQLEGRVSFRRAMKKAHPGRRSRAAPRASAWPAPAGSAARKCPATRPTVRGGCRCTRCGPTSITRAATAVTTYGAVRRQGVDLPRRGPRDRAAEAAEPAEPGRVAAAGAAAANATANGVTATPTGPAGGAR